MYILLVPAISGKISNSIYCLNINHVDWRMKRHTQVNKGDVICEVTYSYPPKMGFVGFLKDTFFGPPSYKVQFKSPVDGTIEGSTSGSFHRSIFRDYDRPFSISSIKDELDNPIAFRFYTSEKLALTAAAFYKDFFDLFSIRSSWADKGMKDCNFMIPIGARI